MGYSDELSAAVSCPMYIKLSPHPLYGQDLVLSYVPSLQLASLAPTRLTPFKHGRRIDRSHVTGLGNCAGTRMSANLLCGGIYVCTLILFSLVFVWNFKN